MKQLPLSTSRKEADLLASNLESLALPFAHVPPLVHDFIKFLRVVYGEAPPTL
eukprot:XP_001704408.1 Hypothetical protein GL50803_24275 [Giardia lamblia ATCC 50803]